MTDLLSNDAKKCLYLFRTVDKNTGKVRELGYGYMGQKYTQPSLKEDGGPMLVSSTSVLSDDLLNELKTNSSNELQAVRYYKPKNKGHKIIKLDPNNVERCTINKGLIKLKLSLSVVRGNFTTTDGKTIKYKPITFDCVNDYEDLFSADTKIEDEELCAYAFTNNDIIPINLNRDRRVKKITCVNLNKEGFPAEDRALMGAPIIIYRTGEYKAYGFLDIKDGNLQPIFIDRQTYNSYETKDEADNKQQSQQPQNQQTKEQQTQQQQINQQTNEQQSDTAEHADHLPDLGNIQLSDEHAFTTTSGVNPNGTEQEQQTTDNQQKEPLEEKAYELQNIQVSAMMENKTLMDKIAINLDRTHAVIKNWENLACSMGVPFKTRAKCKCTTEHSPTTELFEHLSKTQESLTVQELISKLLELKSIKAAGYLQENIPENKRTNKIKDEITNNEEIMEHLAIELENKSKVVKNWFDLGKKLEVKNQDLQNIKNGINGNSAALLFDYIYSAYTSLTVNEFKEIMKKMDREDVIVELNDIQEGQMKDILPWLSDERKYICYLLNAQGSVKDWRYLAHELYIEDHIITSFERKPPESPTIALFEWYLSENPNFSVHELCKHLDKILRREVIEAIEDHYHVKFQPGEL